MCLDVSPNSVSFNLIIFLIKFADKTHSNKTENVVKHAVERGKKGKVRNVSYE